MSVYLGRQSWTGILSAREVIVHHLHRRPEVLGIPGAGEFKVAMGVLRNQAREWEVILCSWDKRDDETLLGPQSPSEVGQARNHLQGRKLSTPGGVSTSPVKDSSTGTHNGVFLGWGQSSTEVEPFYNMFGRDTLLDI